MKVTHRISTGQFEYVEVTTESNDEKAFPQGIKQIHDEIKDAFKPQPTYALPEKEWRRFIERILQGEPNHISELEQCSPNQKLVINEIKKALKRLEARSGDIQMDDGPGKGENGDWSGQD